MSNPVAQWLIAVVAVLYLAAIVLSRRKPWMTAATGVALAVNALLTALALSVGRQLFINALAATEFAAASTEVYDTLLSFLMRTQRVLLLLGVFLVVVGCFAGSNAFGSAVRVGVCGGLEKVGAAVAGSPVARPGRWVAANSRWLRVVIAVFGAVVLLWGADVSEGRLFWSLVLVVVLLVVVQILIGAGSANQTRTPGDAGGGREAAEPPPEALESVSDQT